MPRVAFVCPFGLRPKATVNARALPMAQALHRRGYDVALFVPPWDDPANAGTRSTLDGVPITQVPVSGGILPTVARLQSAVWAFGPDIVHCFKPISYPAAVAWIASRRRSLGRPVSIVLDVDDWEADWLPSLPYPAWQKRLAARQEVWAYRGVDAVTVASEALGSIALALRGGRGGVFDVPNALVAPPPLPAADTVADLRRQHGLGEDTVLLYTRFAEFPVAWPVTLLRALRQRVPQAQLLVVGEGLHGEDAAFARVVQAAGLEQAVVRVGWPGAKAAAAYFATAGVAIVPFTDTLLARAKSSVKLLELMGAGVPIVASAVGENPRYLGYGGAGVLVGGLDVETWADAVTRLLQSPEERTRLSVAAGERLRRCYIWDAAGRPVEEAYASVWPRRRGPRQAPDAA
ncbi:MAG: glycosyltransferase [Anaerolineae bacterium]